MEKDLEEIRPPSLKIFKRRVMDKLAPKVTLNKKGKGKGKDDQDFDPESEGDEDDGNYVDMVRCALKDTRRILGEITEGGTLWEQIYEIFNLFSGQLGDEDEGLKDIILDKNELPSDGKTRIELLALPKFVNYFKVASDDDEYLDNFIDRVSVLAEQEYYVDNGLAFDHLLEELHKYGFLLGTEITEKEPTSVIQAQVMLQIL